MVISRSSHTRTYLSGTRQRIDLFGARKQDLPDIWEELVMAGFESGHAYGNHLTLGSNL